MKKLFEQINYYKMRLHIGAYKVIVSYGKRFIIDFWIKFNIVDLISE